MIIIKDYDIKKVIKIFNIIISIKFSIKLLAFLFVNRQNSTNVNENSVLNQSVAGFIGGKLDETSFKNILRSNNVDPDVFPVYLLKTKNNFWNLKIQKEIRATTVGARNSKSLISNIIKYKDQ